MKLCPVGASASDAACLFAAALSFIAASTSDVELAEAESVAVSLHLWRILCRSIQIVSTSSRAAKLTLHLTYL